MYLVIEEASEPFTDTGTSTFRALQEP